MCVGGAFPIFSKGVIILSWEETETTKTIRICFFMAEDFVDLLFEERLFFFYASLPAKSLSSNFENLAF